LSSFGVGLRAEILAGFALEMTMKIKHASILSATAVALLLLSATAQAHDHDDHDGHGGHGGLCSAATLKGAFEFIGHGVIPSARPGVLQWEAGRT
jgi:hypothetical protein